MAFDFADEQAKAAANVGALTNTERKNAAYNALHAAYGPAIAYDPEAAYNASKASVSEQTEPTQVAQAGANLESTQLTNKDTAGTQNRMAAYRATQMLKSAAGPDGTIPPEAYDQIVRPHADLLGIDPAHVDDFGTMLSQPGGAAHLDTIAQALIGPTKVTGAATYGIGPDGQPVAIVKDQYGNFHQQALGGTAPTQVVTAQTGQKNAATAAAGVPIRQQNANSNTLRANTTENNSVYGSGLPGSTVAPLPADNAKPAAPVIDPNSLFAKLPPKGKAQAIGSATQIVNQGTNLQSTNQILDTVDKQISPYTAGAGSMLKSLPGGAQKDLEANLKTLEAQGLTSWINSLKNSQGQTGIGRVLQSEAKAAMTLFGNMEQDQSAKQLQFHAQLFRRTVNNLYQHAKEGFKAQYGVDPHAALGEHEPAAGAMPGGWKYLGPVK